MVYATRDFESMIVSNKLKQMSPKRRRFIIIALASSLVVILIAGYGLWSMNAWNAYKTTYENWQKDLRTTVDTAMALPAKTAEERAKKLASFKEVTSKISSAQQSLCQTPALIAWQNALGDLHARQETCRGIITRADTFGKKMQATVSYLQSEQSVATAVSKTLTDSASKVTESTWGSQVDTWKQAYDTVAKIPSESSFAPIKTSTLDKLKGLETAWAELIAAHTAKDKTKYTEAQSKLVTAYTALSSLPAMSTEQLMKLTGSLQAAYAQTF